MSPLLFDSLEIRYFRAFDFLKIERLGHINLILGKNNVGKSTLLEALYLHANMGAPQVMRAILDRRTEPYSDTYSMQSPMFDKLFFGNSHISEIRQEIQIGRLGAPDSALRIAVTYVPANPQSISNDTNGTPDYGAGFGDGSGGAVPALQVSGFGDTDYVLPLDRSFDELVRLWNLDKEHEEMITPGQFVPPNGLSSSQFQDLWNIIALRPEKQDVIEALRIISPDITDIALFAPRPDMKAFNLRLRGQDAPVPARSLGDGINRLIGLSMALACAKDGILLVDEIENGIHWSIMPEVWKFIVKVAKRLNVQVFATTHSNDCLKSFHFGTKDNPDIYGVAVRLERRSDEYHAEIFDEQRLAVIVKEGIEIR